MEVAGVIFRFRTTDEVSWADNPFVPGHTETSLPGTEFVEYDVSWLDNQILGKVFAKLMTGGLIMPLNRWSRLAAWSAMVWTISGCPWPIRQDICPEVQSRIRRPVEVYIKASEACVIISGWKAIPACMSVFEASDRRASVSTLS